MKTQEFLTLVQKALIGLNLINSETPINLQDNTELTFDPGNELLYQAICHIPDEAFDNEDLVNLINEPSKITENINYINTRDREEPSDYFEEFTTITIGNTLMVIYAATR